MDDRNKTKEELIRELQALRAEVELLKGNSSTCDLPVSWLPLHNAKVDRSSTVAVKTPLLKTRKKGNLTLQAKEIGNEIWQYNLRKYQQQQELIQSEQLFTGFFSGATKSHVGLFIVDTKLQFLHINQTLADINGYSIEFHLGKLLPTLLPELAPTLTPLFQALIERKQSSANLEVSGYVPSQLGVLRHWLASYFPIFSPTGDLMAIGGMVLEITEYKQAIEALRQNEFNLRTAQRIAHVGSWHWDCVQKTVIWSEEMYRIHGCDPNQPPPQKKELEPYIHPEDFAHYQQLTDRALAGYSFEVDLRIIRPDGEIRYIEARGEPGVFNEQGELLHLYGTVLDVTDRKRVEQALRKSEFALREAQRIAHVGSWQWEEGRKVSWSEEIYRIHGLDPNSSVPDLDKMSKYIHPDDLEIQQAMHNASVRGEPYEFDLRIIRPDGEVRYVEARAEPGIFNERGELIWLFGTVLDVTDRKRVEAQLRQSEANLARAQKIAHIGSWEYDIASQTCTWSEELYRIHQLDPSKPPPVGEQMDCLIHPDDLWIDRQLVKAPLLAGKPCEADLRIVRQDGEIRDIEIRGEPTFDSRGQVTGWVGTVMDITEQRKLERLKHEFISIVSHELRTPLTSMQVALSLLDQQLVDPTSEDGQGMIHVATEGVDRLVRLVNDILDLERLDSGKICIEKQLCYPADLIQSAIDQMKNLANKSNIKFEVSVVPCPVQADPDRLIQVLTNLLSNAIRFSPVDSTIQIHVERCSESVQNVSLGDRGQGLGARDSLGDGGQVLGDREESFSPTPTPQPPTPSSSSSPTPTPQHLTPSSFLQFMVKDRGRGIPSDRLEKIFERFQQVDTSDSREKGGTGLGLAICRTIIVQHGGKIWAESILAKGSSFYFTLPI